MYNAVEDSFFNINDSIKENLIINVGTYSINKNQLLCLDSFYKIASIDYKLVLIGTKKNSYYDKLVKKKRNLIKSLDTEMLKFYVKFLEKILLSTLKRLRYTYSLAIQKCFQLV